MTNHSNKRKFLATTLTATMVAAAVAPVGAAAATEAGSFPDVPAGHWAADAINYLVAKNAINGLPDGTYGPTQNISRGAMAKLLAESLENVEVVEGAKSSFSDVSANHYAAAHIAALEKAGIIDGNEKGLFSPSETLTRESAAKMIVEAYGLELDEKADFNFSDNTSWGKDYINVVASLGILAGTDAGLANPKGDLTRAALAQLVHRAEVPTERVEVPQLDDTTEVKVESVSAINASELQVTFNQAMGASAKNAANYDLKINNVDVATATIIDINLSADGKTATLLLDQSVTAFQNGDKYVIQTNDAILSKSGQKTEKFVSNEATFSETAAPALVSVAKAGDNLVLTFDRPVDASNASNDVTLVKIDGIEIGSKDLKPVEFKAGNADILGEAGVYEYTIAITDPTAKEEAKKLGTHEVVIFDVVDTAKAYPGNASVLTGSYTVTDKVVAPEVVGIEAVNANRFFVYTNTTVTLDADTLVTVNKGTHEFVKDATEFDGSLTAPLAVTKSDATVGQYNGKPGIWVVVSDNDGTVEENPLYRSGEAAVNLTVTVEKFQADGLIGKKAVENVTLNKNNTKPVLDTTSIAADEESLIVKFTNSLVDLTGTDLTSIADTDYIVRDNDGVIQKGFTATVSGDTVTLAKVGTKLTDAPYSVEFKADTFKNKEDRTSVAKYIANTVKNDKIVASVGKEAANNFKYSEYKFDTVATDADSLSNTNNYFVDVAKNTITFKYAKKMGNSARDVANYTLDGKALPAGTTADFVGDKQTVRIVFPKDTFKTSTQYKFGISTNVKTDEGSIIVGSLQTKAPAELVFGVTDNVKPELASAVYYVGTDTPDNQTKTDQIEVTFNEAVHTETDLTDAADDFKVTINGSDFEVATVAEVTSGSKANHKFILTLKQEVNISQAATITIVPEDDQLDKTMGILDDATNKAKEGSKITLAGNNYKFSSALAVKYQANADIATDVAALTVALDPATLTLASTGTNGTTITWASSDTAVVTDAGAYTGTGSAILTATVSKAPGTDVLVKFTVTADGTGITAVTKQ